MNGAERKRDSGFTLVELLVALCVVALLAALLVPSLNKALQGARKAETATAMRHLGSAISLYAGEHDGRLPGPFSMAMFNYGRISPVGGDLSHLGAYLSPYLGATADSGDVAAQARQFPLKALKCPALAPVARNDPTVANYRTWDHPTNTADNTFGGSPATGSLTMTTAGQSPYQPRRLASVTFIGANTPILSTPDREIWNSSSNGSLPAKGVFDGNRMWLFLDGSVALNPSAVLWTR